MSDTTLATSEGTDEPSGMAPAGNASRDQGVLILWNALMPHAELPPAEAARKLEAAVHARYTRGNGDNAAADPGAEYIRRLRVLWGWLSPDSKDAVPQLKRMVLQGGCPSSATCWTRCPAKSVSL